MLIHFRLGSNIIVAMYFIVYSTFIRYMTNNSIISVVIE